MNFEDFRKQNADTLSEHELTEDELERLIENKFKRARAYQLAFKTREVEVVDND